MIFTKWTIFGSFDDLIAQQYEKSDFHESKLLNISAHRT